MPSKRRVMKRFKREMGLKYIHFHLNTSKGKIRFNPTLRKKWRQRVVDYLKQMLEYVYRQR